jgi:hypothetical protein
MSTKNSKGSYDTGFSDGKGEPKPLVDLRDRSDPKAVQRGYEDGKLAREIKEGKKEKK